MSNESSSRLSDDSSTPPDQESSSAPVSPKPSSPLPPPPPPSHFKRESDQKLIRLALHNSPFFTCLDEEQIERWVATAERKVFAPGEAVILEGCVDIGEEDDDDAGGKGEDVPKEEGNQLEPDQKLPVEQETAESDAEIVGEEGPTVSTEQEGSETANMGEIIVGEASEAPDHPVNDNLEGKGQEESLSEQKDSEGTSAGDDLVVDENDSSNAESQGKDEDALPKAAQSTWDNQAASSFFGPTNLGKVELSSSSSSSILPPTPPKSGLKRSIYIVKSGHADVWYRTDFNPASLGPGTLFGEGGFLFGRQHSASVVAHRKDGLECYVLDFDSFCQYVLPSQNMSELFHKYASEQEKDGTFYMTMEDFVRAIEAEESGNIPTMQDPLVGLRIANTYNILSHNRHRNRQRGQQYGAAPSNEDITNRIYLSDFCFYHLLMARPDPEVDIAFLLMDVRRTGQIQLDDLAKFVEPIAPDLDLTSLFFTRYFGKDGTLCIRQPDFSQFLVDLQREMGKQAFLRAVEERGIDGHLAPIDFVQVLKTSCGWRLPHGVADRLESIYCDRNRTDEAAPFVSMRLSGASAQQQQRQQGATQTSKIPGVADGGQREMFFGKRYFGYGDFLAFQEVLSILPGICNVIDRAQEIKEGPLSPDDFKVANRVLGLGGRLSRRQVDIIFTLFDLDRDGFVSHEDTVSVCGVDFAQRLVAVKGRGGSLTFAPPPKSRHDHDTESSEDEQTDAEHIVQHFGLSALAGALGVLVLHPLELVKTRLMNQRITLHGTGQLYLGSLDCMGQVLRAEGFIGLYRGIIPQLLGIAPERAIKLHVNSLLRQAFSSNDSETCQQKINLPLEMLAGACAGACQLLVTNPMEITKTRLILQSETAQIFQRKGLTQPPNQTFQSVVRDLGVPGLYRGASACLLRDIPFSAIYFPTYAACKSFLAEQHDEASGMSNKTSVSDLLLAGTLAGIPAAYITTPFDVIRVRLQAAPRRGEMTYSGIHDCATRVYETEGIQGLFRGSGARVLRIAPQFGISLLAYEKITDWLGFHSASSPPTNAPVDPSDYRTAFSVTSLRPKIDDNES